MWLAEISLKWKVNEPAVYRAVSGDREPARKDDLCLRCDWQRKGGRRLASLPGLPPEDLTCNLLPLIVAVTQRGRTDDCMRLIFRLEDVPNENPSAVHCNHFSCWIAARVPLTEDIFLDKGLHNPASTSKDVHSQLLQTKIGLETQQTKVKTRCID
jgi:hypothetical protein